MTAKDDVVVPAGAPAWLTPELIESTIRVWQPYYGKPLSADDALEMILNVANLYALLREGIDERSLK